ncbi:isochorismatase domain-containing protein 1-like [Sitodiplosis mosellana]|uniref:isochorismatase domain-containing protein 1-like n=1 Tax=Sitodiplosis mosellana TaxID=263140 RepID=UPI002444128B|nr:isochorismatase domain-containing protein 1-like [Sitodiplosis mosellana]XP_055312750.1 isochorismatase domain-containing protein 1-like [Sitodiplosis mosellana]
MALRSTLGRLQSESTLFLLCDLQDKFRSVAHHIPAIITNAQKLLSSGKQLDIKLIVTEQYPERLGKTAPELNVSHAIGVYPKLEFSIMKDEKLKHAIIGLNNVKSVVLFGLETHICIEQTAMDLLDNDYDVHIVADCTTSRSVEDRCLAFQRLRQIGCFITTSENVIFKLLGGKTHPQFSWILPLVSKKSEESGLAGAHFLDA